MVRNLRQGGGGGYSNAYRALNMHREYLVEEGIKAIFWLSDGEGRQLARFAPDFWAFRHLVVAFPELPSNGKLPETNADSQREYDAEDWIREGEKYFSLGCYEDAMRSHRRALRKKPGEASILLKIAEAQIAMHATSPARRALRLAADGNHFGRELHQEYSRLKTLLKSEQDSKGGCAEG
jgi:tetratricopeptide (TPR) repeat protein